MRGALSPMTGVLMRRPCETEMGEASSSRGAVMAAAPRAGRGSWIDLIFSPFSLFWRIHLKPNADKTMDENALDATKMPKERRTRDVEVQVYPKASTSRALVT